MEMPRVLITTRSFRKLQGPHQQFLRDAGFQIINSPYDRPLTGDELSDLIVGIDAAILGVDDVTSDVIEAADRLRVIARYGVGVDKVDLASATAHGVVVTNTPGGNTNSVAELTIGLMLSLARHIPRQDRQIRADDWTLVRGIELSGKVLGLVGFGRIGRRVAELAAVFGMCVQFYDPYPPSDAILQQLHVDAVSLEELLQTSDFVSLHLPLSDDTIHLIGDGRLALMKSTAYLINTARGGIIDEGALFIALKLGQLAGAAFDTFETEPSIGNPLLQLDNFISTPHAGSATEQTTLRMGLMAAQNVVDVLNGMRPVHVVNPEVYAKLGL
jgi:D-3-phosphoglycerate dehydrogenase